MKHPSGPCYRPTHALRRRSAPPNWKHDPFKVWGAAPPSAGSARSTRKAGPNLAPYSFFNGVADRLPLVMFSSGGRKDSLANVEATGEFTVSLAGWDQRDAMNTSSAPLAPAWTSSPPPGCHQNPL